LSGSTSIADSEQRKENPYVEDNQQSAGRGEEGKERGGSPREKEKNAKELMARRLREMRQPFTKGEGGGIRAGGVLRGGGCSFSKNEKDEAEEGKSVGKKEKVNRGSWTKEKRKRATRSCTRNRREGEKGFRTLVGKKAGKGGRKTLFEGNLSCLKETSEKRSGARGKKENTKKKKKKKKKKKGVVKGSQAIKSGRTDCMESQRGHLKTWVATELGESSRRASLGNSEKARPEWWSREKKEREQTLLL